MTPLSSRDELIDRLRGLALALLVLEAARQYFHSAAYLFDPIDPARSTPAIFITRWLTFLAPSALALLAGVAIRLRRASNADDRTLSIYLVKRGLFLMVLELTVVAFGRDFALPPPILFAALGTLGVALIAMAVLIWLPPRVVLGLAALALLLTDALGHVHSWSFGRFAPIWQYLHEAIVVIHGDKLIAEIDYAAIPWTAMVMLGYGLAPIFQLASKQRDRRLILLGACLLAIFAVLRFSNLYGDPQPWSPQADAAHTLMSYFFISKFPPSLNYACATLGVTLLLAPLIARLPSMPGRVLRTLGAAPLLAYVAHFYLMHALSLLALALSHQDVTASFDQVGKMAAAAQQHVGVGFDLPVVYAAWLTVLALLYPLCRWSIQARERHGQRKSHTETGAPSAA